MKTPNSKTEEVCAGCGCTFLQSSYSKLCDAITQRKPTCSGECNKKANPDQFVGDYS